MENQLFLSDPNSRPTTVHGHIIHKRDDLNNETNIIKSKILPALFLSKLLMCPASV